MRHLTLKATTTVTDTDLGQFEAVVSAWDADREGDTIAVTAFDETIRAWRESGKSLPLLFEHGTETVGHIDPATMKATEDGLVASGEIDRDTERGRQAWRMVKSGVAGFSIGFMSDSRERADGGRELVSIDLLEVSITSKPMHPATRALSWKAATDSSLEREYELIAAAFADNQHLLSTKAVRSHAELEAEVKRLPEPPKPIQTARFDC